MLFLERRDSCSFLIVPIIQQLKTISLVNRILLDGILIRCLLMNTGRSCDIIVPFTLRDKCFRTFNLPPMEF